MSQESIIDRALETVIGEIVSGGGTSAETAKLRELGAKRSMLMTRPAPARLDTRKRASAK